MPVFGFMRIVTVVRSLGGWWLMGNVIPPLNVKNHSMSRLDGKLFLIYLNQISLNILDLLEGVNECDDVTQSS